MLAIKLDTRYRFKSKRVKYTAVWKKSIKMVKESKLSSFTTFPSSIFFIPSSTIFLIFPPQFFYSLLHNCSYFPSSIFFIPSTTIFVFSLLILEFSPPKEDSLLSLTILIDFFQIAVYLTLFVLKRYLVSDFIVSTYQSRV